MFATLGLWQAQAQQDDQISFAGGHFKISELESMEKSLSFDGKEIARDYMLFLDRMLDLEDAHVALFWVGPGGNACGAATLIVWKPKEGGDVQSARAGDDCSSPSPSITDEGSIYFVPYMVPGRTSLVQRWTVEGGLRVVGELSFIPEPGTRWDQLDLQHLPYLVDLFSNEEIYLAASSQLGDALNEYVQGLFVSDGFHHLPSGIAYGYGCVPHACGVQDSFIAIDIKQKLLYFAQKDGDGGIRSWPDISDWPMEIATMMTDLIAK